MKQLQLFNNTNEAETKRSYSGKMSAIENKKGVLDCDTVKGCTLGMATYPDGGCYGECYANKIASRYGIDFSASVSRKFVSRKHFIDCFLTIKNHYNRWYRIGTSGDPSHDWENTVDICEKLQGTGKIPVIITKHWIQLSGEQIIRLKKASALVNTSTSGLDKDVEIKYRVAQMGRLKYYGVKSILRVVTCCFGSSLWARSCKDKQDYLLSFSDVIDNPLRASNLNKHVLTGDIVLTKNTESVGGGKFVSLHSPGVHIGTCKECPDQCGVK